MSKYRVWYDGDPEYTNFDSLAQALKYVRKTKALDESNSGLEECIDGYWDEWMDSDDQEIHDHLYMYGGKSPYLKKMSVEKSEPVRPSIMDTVSFSREDLVASLEEEDDDDEENEEDAYDEIIDPDEEVLDEEGLDERLMNVIGVSPKTTTETTASKDETEEFIGEDEISEFDDEEEDDLDEEEEEDEK
ncbi:hypothetical protein LNTAR_05829 [Lentisphaera araneosa HTCC2155]|uniref:Uncharacterized protein n=1 Tax=Lentisphaera araneosa HTCC2155 TaxID=313628 RepID=A6DPH4_9BACT|nr:hypothetical protein [Lentisphaera araneosa]EDM26470.1 hypothetical protein LNTAR_05829 [Lentisphaera araneosa HTCC2155]